MYCEYGPCDVGDDANDSVATLKHIHCAGRIRKMASPISSVYTNLLGNKIYIIRVLP